MVRVSTNWTQITLNTREGYSLDTKITKITFNFEIQDDAALIKLERLFITHGLNYEVVEEWLPMAQVADKFGLSRITLSSAVRTYKSVPGQKRGRDWFVRESDVQRALADGRLQPGKFGPKAAMKTADKITDCGQDDPGG